MQLTEQQVVKGWKPIESKEALRGIYPPFCKFMDSDGVGWNAFNDIVAGMWKIEGLGDFTDMQVVLNFTAYRPVTDNADELAKLHEENERMKQEHDAWADNLISKNDELAMENIKLRAQLAEQPTLRDQFAMAALTGLAANPHSGALCSEKVPVFWAYQQADAMLAQRSKGDNDG